MLIIITQRVQAFCFSTYSDVRMNLLVLYLSYSDAFQNGFDIDNKQLFSKGFTQYYIKAEH